MSVLGDRSRPTNRSLNWVWDINLLDWVVMTQPGGSGGGGAVTIVDGGNVVEGATTDVAVQGDNPGTISAKLRGLNKSIAAGLAVTGPLTDAQLRAVAVPVSGAISFTAPQHVIIDSSAAIAVTGPLTDTQLRATPVPVSGTVAVSGSLASKSDVIAPSGNSTWNNGTALNTALTVATAGYGVVMFKGTPASGPNGRISFEGSTDGGATYEAVTAMLFQIVAASITENNPALYANFTMSTYSSPWIAYINVNAYTHVRARIAIVISSGGSLVISSVASAIPTRLGQPAGTNIWGVPYPSSASNITNLPVMTTGTSTNGLLVALVDGANNVSTIKASSVAPVSTDTALVVTTRDSVTVRGGAKGTTTAADITSSSAGADHRAMDVTLINQNGLLLGQTVALLIQGGYTANSNTPDTHAEQVLPAVASAVIPVNVEGRLVNLSTDLSGNLRTTSNATATAVPPTYTEGSLNVALSEDLSGNLRVTLPFSDRDNLNMLQLLGQVVAELKAMRLQLALMGGYVDSTTFEDSSLILN